MNARGIRKAKNAKRIAAAAGLHRTEFRPAPAIMAANPNTGKRHNAPHTNGAYRDALRERRATDSRRGFLPGERLADGTLASGYRPLTVRTPITTAASGRKLAARHHTDSSYTI